MIGGGVIQQKVNEFASKLTTNRFRCSNALVQPNGQCELSANCSYEYLILHMNGMLEHKETLTNLMLSQKYSKYTPLPIAVSMMKFYDERLFSLDTMLATSMKEFIRKQFHSTIHHSTSPQLSLSFPWLKETLLNMIMQFLPSFHEMTSLQYLTEEELSPFLQWAKYWPDIEESCKSNGDKRALVTLEKKRKFQQLIDSVMLGLSASFVDGKSEEGFNSGGLQQFITSILGHLDAIPSLPHMTSLLDGLSSSNNLVAIESNRFTPTVYRGNWESAKDYSVVANRYDFSDFVSHNNHTFLTDTQLTGGGQESFVLSKSSQQKHK
jgi:hypothetical protein